MTETPKFELEDYEDIELRTNYDKLVKREKTISKEKFVEAANKISRDNARTPMQWNNSENAGFTKGRPWFKLNPNYTDINVEADQKNQKSIFKYYQSLIRLRHNNPILVEGKFELILPDDPNIFAYFRSFEQKKWLVIANLSNHSVDNPVVNDCADGKVIVHNYSDKNNFSELKPYEAAIIVVKSRNM